MTIRPITPTPRASVKPLRTIPSPTLPMTTGSQNEDTTEENQENQGGTPLAVNEVEMPPLDDLDAWEGIFQEIIDPIIKASARSQIAIRSRIDWRRSFTIPGPSEDSDIPSIGFPENLRTISTNDVVDLIGRYVGARERLTDAINSTEVLRKHFKEIETKVDRYISNDISQRKIPASLVAKAVRIHPLSQLWERFGADIKAENDMMEREIRSLDVKLQALHKEETRRIEARKASLGGNRPKEASQS